GESRVGHVHVDVCVMPAEAGGARKGGVRWEGDTIAISVSDDGPGIPLDVRNTLFEPFVTTKIGGSGLGLPIVHRAVEAHNGVVFVDALNPGARFTIWLPRNQARATLTDQNTSRFTGVAA
ncbi:MAG: HAMP domain-containing sensor histidine kinase, partial [Gemmatimonadaceae bacterium]